MRSGKERWRDAEMYECEDCGGTLLRDDHSGEYRHASAMDDYACPGWAPCAGPERRVRETVDSRPSFLRDPQGFFLGAVMSTCVAVILWSDATAIQAVAACILSISSYLLGIHYATEMAQELVA